MNARQADRLLRLTNRLLRGYRRITRDATITELSRAEASPFRFPVVSKAANPTALGSLSSSTTADLHENSPHSAPRPSPSESATMLASGNEPEVADLFLLDAERAIHEGRFREAVLFCWSTIDSTFSRKYDDLVDSKLAGRMGRGPGVLQRRRLRLEEENERRVVPRQRSIPVPRIR